MPFESEQQNRKSTLRKTAFMEGFYATLAKAAALPPSRELDLTDYKSTSRLIMKIIHDNSIPQADKNHLIARLEARGPQPLANPRMLAGTQISPFEQLLYNRSVGSPFPPAVAASLKSLLNLGMLSRTLNLPPMLGTQARIIDRRRKPEEEWRSPWKTRPA